MAAAAKRLHRGSALHSPLPRFWSGAFLAAALSFLFAMFQPPAAEAGGPWDPIIGAAGGPGGTLYDTALQLFWRHPHGSFLGFRHPLGFLRKRLF